VVVFWYLVRQKVAALALLTPPAKIVVIALVKIVKTAVSLAVLVHLQFVKTMWNVKEMSAKACSKQGNLHVRLVVAQHVCLMCVVQVGLVENNGNNSLPNVHLVTLLCVQLTGAVKKIGVRNKLKRWALFVHLVVVRLATVGQIIMAQTHAALMVAVVQQVM